MKIILQDEVIPLGRPGDVVNVSDGYARNYLFPRKKALPATQANLKNLDQLKNSLLKKRTHQETLAKELAEKLSGLELVIPKKVGEKEKLFGSVTPKDVQAIIKEKGYDIDKHCIQLHEPIKSLGEFPVNIRLSQDVTATVKLKVVAG
ncbi:MAG: 50S ribosomal protein L9 [Deltaproteobacteria bacterium]|nr:50S ribosomal protein L9 [Deltaproteobacteria bacterium]